jgi:hypothetical protein
MVVDCDSKEAIDKVEHALPETFEPIISVSPRGGRHYYFACHNGKWKTIASALDHIDIRANGGVIVAPPSRRDDGAQYQWLNCMEFKKEILQDVPESLEHILINNYLEYNAGAGARVAQDIPNRKLFIKGTRDNDLFELAKTLRRAGKSPEYILQVLEHVSLSFRNDGFGVEVLKEKIKSTFGHADKEEKSLAEEIKEWVMSTSGPFMSTEVHKDLDLSTRVHKKNCSEILRRLIADGILERHGDKNGCFRKVEKEMIYMDYVNVSPETVDINMPFHLHDVAEITPKAIIVVAGSTNSGKTAFFLNLVKMNMDKFNEFYYFNSETSAQTFRKRLDKFGLDISYWSNKLKVIDRVKNFSDVINPDGINIIDYLELDPEKTYKVCEYIRDIFNKLNKGIAFIGIQKASNASFGRGGEFTLEKAQLAISMDYDKAKIIKCKAPKNGFDYHNSIIDFKITSGCTIQDLSGWKKEL